MEGWVYVVSNESMPGIVKIGRTSKTPSKRMDSLFSSSVPTPFVLEWSEKYADSIHAEKQLHDAFRGDRVNPKREFFSVEPEKVAAYAECNLISHKNQKESELRRTEGRRNFGAGIYLVRFIDSDYSDSNLDENGDTNWYMLVTATRIDDLFWLIDEVVDPGLTEYTKLSGRAACVCIDNDGHWGGGLGRVDYDEQKWKRFDPGASYL